MRRSWLTALLGTSLFGCGDAGSPAALSRIPLDQGWTLAVEGVGPVPATVPGTVHTDLLGAGVIPDPFQAAMEDSLAWISETDWTYRLDFELPKQVQLRDRHELVFEGLDTYASVTLNGVRILEADNMFREWRVDVRELLQASGNVLEIRFAPALARGRAFPPERSHGRQPTTTVGIGGPAS